MEKLLKLIEQVRFAELQKVDHLSKALEQNKKTQDGLNVTNLEV